MPRFARLSEVRMHYLDEGRGDVVVLLHGWPQTSHEWRHIVPILSQRFRVIVPDLRGFGDSSCPTQGFDVGALAGDVVELMDALRITSFSLVGHDWGGRIAFAAALLARARVSRLVLVDATLPHIRPDGEAAFSVEDWQQGFHRIANLPEALLAGKEELYLRWFYDEHSERAGGTTLDDIAEYARCYARPGSMRCSFELDRALEVSAAFIQSHVGWDGRLEIPTLSVAGGAGRGRGAEAEATILPYASQVEAHLIGNCGRLIPEEAPDELSKKMLPFLLGKRVEQAALPWRP